MIRTFYLEDIVNRLAAIITYGLNGGYSYRSIEERIISSSFINKLERNEYDGEPRIESLVESTYGIRLGGNKADISFKGLFFAESYLKLFLHFNRSFEYIFLYWPLPFFVEKYGVYHEMDFSSLRSDFEVRTKETPLLNKLAKDRQIKLADISKFTGISANTIDKYARDDKYLHAASYEKIYRLASLFDVKENIFASNLAVYLDQAIYLFHDRNRDYRNHLGLCFASFYDKRISETDFVYSEEKNCFITKTGLRLVVFADNLANLPISKLSEWSDSRTFLVLIPSAFLGNESNFDYLKKLDALDVFILTQDHIYAIKKQRKEEITDAVYKALTIKAKEIVLH